MPVRTHHDLPYPTNYDRFVTVPQLHQRRRDEVSEALTIGCRAEALGFPQMAASCLDLAEAIGGSAPADTWRFEIRAAWDCLDAANNAWRRATSDAGRFGTVMPGAYDRGFTVAEMTAAGRETYDRLMQSMQPRAYGAL